MHQLVLYLEVPLYVQKRSSYYQTAREQSLHLAALIIVFISGESAVLCGTCSASYYEDDERMAHSGSEHLWMKQGRSEKI